VQCSVGTGAAYGPRSGSVHLGLDLLFLVPGASGGRETYARELTSAIRAQRNDLRVTAFVNRETAAVGQGFWHDVADDTVVLSGASAVDRRRWAVGELVMLPRAAARQRVDVLHCPANFAPLHGPFARVLTLHDLVFRRLPDAVPTLVRWGTEATVPLGARRAHRIITGSDAARDDIVAELKLARDRIDVIPHGIAAVPSVPDAALARMRARLAAGGRPIALSVATDVPHKNLAVLLRALTLLAPEERPLLAFAGSGTDAGELPGLVGELDLGDDVRILGAVARDDLEALYAQAHVLVTATLYEGFGLPVLEAMARGVLVACSDLPVLREVAGGDAEMLDPREPASIAAALRRLLSGDAELERRREAGRGRAAGHTWSSAARQTLRVFDEAVAARAGR
jgi:glycosyltransferase involved in cell wall biosynthesis